MKHTCLSSSCAHSQGSCSPGRRQPKETRSCGWASRSCTEVTVWGSQIAEQNGPSDGQGKWRAEQPESGKKKVTVAPTWTDNRGNGSALNKLMTTKFPACAVLMELSAYMKRMSMKVVVEWTPQSRQSRSRSLGELGIQAVQPAESRERESCPDAVGCFAGCSESR